MILRPAFVALVFVTCGYCLAWAQPQKVNSNAGTGPYDFSPQLGMTGLGPALSRIAERLASLEATNSVDEGYIKNIKQVLVDMVAELKALSSSGIIGGRGRVSIDTVVDHAHLLIESEHYKEAIPILRSIEAYIERRASSSMRSKKIMMLKTGLIYHRDSSYLFDSVVASFGERGPSRAKSSFLVNVGGYVPLNGGSNEPTGRTGAVVAFGDPLNRVFEVGATGYFSPRAYDISFNMSLKVGKLNERVFERETRSVVDHVRPGDVWMTLGGRRLDGSNSSDVITNGTIGEAALTFALPKQYLGTYQSTTLTVSGVYCANKDLRIDELGFDVRTPLNSVGSPMFLCARYGTRGHCTLALEFKL